MATAGAHPVVSGMRRWGGDQQHRCPRGSESGHGRHGEPQRWAGPAGGRGGPTGLGRAAAPGTRLPRPSGAAAFLGEASRCVLPSCRLPGPSGLLGCPGRPCRAVPCHALLHCAMLLSSGSCHQCHLPALGTASAAGREPTPGLLGGCFAPSPAPSTGEGPGTAVQQPQRCIPEGAGCICKLLTARHTEASWELWPGTGLLESALDLLPCQWLPGKGDSD